MKNNAFDGFTNEYQRQLWSADFDFDFEGYYNDYFADECDEYAGDALCPYALEADWIHTYGNVGHKLDKFMNMPKSFKKFDPENCHPDVQLRYAYGDPLHRAPHWEMYRKMMKIVTGIIRKNEMEHVHQICYLIKKRVEFKTNIVYRNIARNFIKVLQNPNVQYGYNLHPYKITECGHLYVPNEPVKYYFPHGAYDEFKTYMVQRIKDHASSHPNTMVFVNDDFESLVVIQQKLGNKKANHKMITTSLYDLFVEQNQREFVEKLHKELSNGN